MKVSPSGLQALEEYRTSQPALFDHSVANEDTHAAQEGVDEARGVLVQAKEGASLDEPSRSDKAHSRHCRAVL